VGQVLSALGETLTDAKQPGDAVLALERATTVLDRAPHIDPETRVAARWRLAVALWDDAVARKSHDRAVRERARALAEEALRELITLRTADPSDVRELRAWLATHHL
jgi:hypothetical protein